MTGRGLPGAGFVKYEDPEDIKVTIGLRTTVSRPTVRLPPSRSPDDENTDARETAKPEDEVFINVHTRIIRSTNPSSPVTLATWKTSIERPEPGSTYSRVWSEKGLSFLESTSVPYHRCGPYPSMFLTNCHRGGFARNLRESWDFITIPSLDSGEEVTVQHRLPVERLKFIGPEKGEGALPEEGEKFRISPNAGSLGTWWWNWGDLEGELKHKKFKSDNWYRSDEHPEGDEIAEGDEWLESEGDNGAGLAMEIQGSAEIEFVT